MKRVLVVGASGLLGRSICEALSNTADVVQASRSGSPEKVDISDPASISELFDRVGPVDGLVCVAGTAPFLPWSALTDDDWANGLANKLMGQVNLTRKGAPFLRDGGAIVLTSGLLSEMPMVGSSIMSTINAAVNAFVRSAALEISRGVRVNAVSPGWVAESMVAMGMDPSPGMPAADIARIFVGLLDGESNGMTVPAVKAG